MGRHTVAVARSRALLSQSVVLVATAEVLLAEARDQVARRQRARDAMLWERHGLSTVTSSSPFDSESS
jgi:hypothetical protein